MNRLPMMTRSSYGLEHGERERAVVRGEIPRNADRRDDHEAERAAQSKSGDDIKKKI